MDSVFFLFLYIPSITFDCNILWFLCRNNMWNLLFCLFATTCVCLLALINVVVCTVLPLLSHDVQIGVRLSVVSYLSALSHWPGRTVLIILVVYISVLFSHCVRVLVRILEVFLLSYRALLDDELSVWNGFLYNTLYQLSVHLVFIQKLSHRSSLIFNYTANILSYFLYFRFQHRRQFWSVPCDSLSVVLIFQYTCCARWAYVYVLYCFLENAMRMVHLLTRSDCDTEVRLQLLYNTKVQLKLLLISAHNFANQVIYVF